MDLKGNQDIKNSLIEAFQNHKKNNFKDAQIIYQEILNKNKFLKYFHRDDITSLEAWAKFEEKNPSSFMSMYQFWVKKII